ncbi:nuclear transport factor 2 family protein [Rhodococcus sp. IEGM 1307]|uniref:nuclear transport factor 2 family protein n=1 Tax=Rhodococcus sp. IEGM 1307 TaxID=3047091 RepID=UPI0024B771B8|nr:nuclear transport factor 2 family protein [Rhodococcus sp. IEGM 1307]MDI9980160.1 nuclear transport factor 2 family protein [Rhodococcus sp. IEGM 1307]
MSDADTIFAEVLAAWGRCFNGGDARGVSDMFTANAIFQGLRPEPKFGKGEILTYYENVPASTTVLAQPISVYRIGGGVIGGIAEIVFTGPDGRQRPVNLSMLLCADRGAWRICHYHVSNCQPAD